MVEADEGNEAAFQFKPNGWIIIVFSRFYILILRGISPASILNIAYLVFDVYFDFWSTWNNRV